MTEKTPVSSAEQPSVIGAARMGAVFVDAPYGREGGLGIAARRKRALCCAWCHTALRGMLSELRDGVRSVSVKQGWDLKWNVQSTDHFAQRREI